MWRQPKITNDHFRGQERIQRKILIYIYATCVFFPKIRLFIDLHHRYKSRNGHRMVVLPLFLKNLLEFIHFYWENIATVYFCNFTLFKFVLKQKIRSTTSKRIVALLTNIWLGSAIDEKDCLWNLKITFDVFIIAP